MANLPDWVSEAKPTGLLTTVIDKNGARQLDGKGLAAYMEAGLDDDQRKLAAWIRIAETITYDERRLPPTARAAIRRDAEREAYTRKVAAWARVVKQLRQRSAEAALDEIAKLQPIAYCGLEERREYVINGLKKLWRQPLNKRLSWATERITA